MADRTPPRPNVDPAPGFRGGFLEQNPLCAYRCDLSSLPMNSNYEYIPKISRQMRALWPEFSWLGPGPAGPGGASTRYFQMFAPDISRVGYDDRGRTLSIMCPQQALYDAALGTMNVEVTVTNQRGWVDESVLGKDPQGRGLKSFDHIFMAADIVVKPRIWFSPSAAWRTEFDVIRTVLELAGLKFPLSKENAIELFTYDTGGQRNPNIQVRDGMNIGFESPSWAIHDKDEAWAVANLGVEIGPIDSTGNEFVDGFNRLVMNLFNLMSGNMLKEGSVLTWNVWLDAPAKADPDEWAKHAEVWRKSLDNGTGYPEGDPGVAKDFDGNVFSPENSLIEEAWNDVVAWLKEKKNVTLPSLPLTSGSDSLPAQRPPLTVSH